MVRHETKVLRSPIQEDPPTAVLKNRAIAQELSPAGVKDQDFLLLAAPAPLEYEDYDGHESMVDLIRCFLRVLFSSTTTYVEHRRSMSPAASDLFMALELFARQQSRPTATYLSHDDSDNEEFESDDDCREKDDESGDEKYDTDVDPLQEDDDAGGDDVMNNGNGIDTAKTVDEAVLLAPSFFGFFPPLIHENVLAPNDKEAATRRKLVAAMWKEIGQEGHCDLHIKNKTQFFEVLGKALDAYMVANAIQYQLS
mmetsp:Transcript_106187/g.295678  ORF Transcript_106187/g.295678 Transcript_106187/m.295678 type:complete len:254 (-) Transcript_106187:228-989(-)